MAVIRSVHVNGPYLESSKSALKVTLAIQQLVVAISRSRSKAHPDKALAPGRHRFFIQDLLDGINTQALVSGSGRKRVGVTEWLRGHWNILRVMEML